MELRLLLLLLSLLCCLQDGLVRGLSIANNSIGVVQSDASASNANLMSGNMPVLGIGASNSGSNSSVNSGAGLGVGGGATNVLGQSLGDLGGGSAGASSVGTSAGSASGNNSAMVQAPKEKLYEKCTGPGDPGPCKQYIYKWRYESTTNECATFIWGGCDGNPHNRFSTEAECLFHCIGGPRK
ncbi:kunitz-type serine protease inhibitor bitisilin-3-like [Scaptodrosophila lebanonensis]|uniref:Kunitz-type serine protease inhibitor bitisilin-3-like n=1 Tax=Drosophila lebanonensis TaxID=7225 RepID=A0A6J2T8P2_DROLE|nr:kunitz-type serine protease inhibitor bitisilin-3-like [Scaptodrosophila lebanonensis]